MGAEAEWVFVCGAHNMAGCQGNPGSISILLNTFLQHKSDFRMSVRSFSPLQHVNRWASKFFILLVRTHTTPSKVITCLARQRQCPTGGMREKSPKNATCRKMDEHSRTLLATILRTCGGRVPCAENENVHTGARTSQVLAAGSWQVLTRDTRT
jgi:hypothetical protein